MKYLLLIGSFLMSLGCSSFGTRPNDEVKETFWKSKQFNKEKGVFQNRRPNLYEEMSKKAMSWKLVKEWLSAGEDRVPTDKLPEIKPELDKFLEPSGELKVIWFGHSSFLLNLDGKIVLVDPVFSDAASPVGFLVNRFQEPVLKLEELPKIDFILISHDHYDHLDMESIKFFLDRETRFVTPLGVGAHIHGWGVDKEKIIEKDWWENFSEDGINFVATPAQHFSGRDGFHPNETLWASWVIQTENHNVYFSGDSGYDIHFKEIGDRYGPFDVAFIESGQYNPRWREVHMLPEDGVKAFKDLRAQKYFPIHWGMFELSIHSWYDPIEKLFKLAKENEFDLIAPKIGEIVMINDFVLFDKWWERGKQTAQIEGEIQFAVR